jgi:SAM-dependent methyltransferase
MAHNEKALTAFERESVAGAEYVERIGAKASDRSARMAFQNLAMTMVPHGGAVFDFGAGPGIDARFYAERGLRVAAYDVDPIMCEYFTEYCRDLIQSGRVFLDHGEYADFLAGESVSGIRDFDLITSNFAPLNLIDNLQELFAKFHALSSPRGKVLASVLSPYYVGDMRYLWWWRNALRLWRDGHYFVPGVQARIFRRRIGDFAKRSTPYFELKQVFCGLPTRRTRDAEGLGVSGGEGRAGLLASKARFMFLLFEKQ